MKIGIYSPYLDTLTGGEKYIFTIAACLSKEHEITIFWDDKSIVGKASEKFNLNLQNVNVSENIFNKNIGTLKRIVKSRKYDRIIYLSDGSIPIVGSKKLLIHFQFPIEWINAKSIGFKIKKRRIDGIFCNSYFTKTFIDKKLRCDSNVLYPPCDINKDKISEKQNLILTVGRFSLLPNGKDFKKLEFLAAAFKEFKKKKLKGWKFAVVTSVMPKDEEKFLEFQKKIAGKDIKVYKNISYQKIISLYGKAKIYWHAAGYGEDLEKNPERAEHFGMSTVEAMSYYAVPIVINAGGQKEIVKNGESGYLWENIEELVKYTHSIATNKKLYEKLSQNAFSVSQNFGIDRFCEELNHLVW